MTLLIWVVLKHLSHILTKGNKKSKRFLLALVKFFFNKKPPYVGGWFLVFLVIFAFVWCDRSSTAHQYAQINHQKLVGARHPK